MFSARVVPVECPRKLTLQGELESSGWNYWHQLNLSILDRPTSDSPRRDTCERIQRAEDALHNPNDRLTGWGYTIAHARAAESLHPGSG